MGVFTGIAGVSGIVSANGTFGLGRKLLPKGIRESDISKILSSSILDLDVGLFLGISNDLLSRGWKLSPKLLVNSP